MCGSARLESMASCGDKAGSLRMNVVIVLRTGQTPYYVDSRQAKTAQGPQEVDYALHMAPKGCTFGNFGTP